MNYEGWTKEKVEKLELIGKLKNNWRQRYVNIYQHPYQIDKVISVGHPFDGLKPIICVENKTAFLHAISIFPNIEIYN